MGGEEKKKLISSPLSFPLLFFPSGKGREEGSPLYLFPEERARGGVNVPLPRRRKKDPLPVTLLNSALYGKGGVPREGEGESRSVLVTPRLCPSRERGKKSKENPPDYDMREKKKERRGKKGKTEVAAAPL